MAIYLGIDGGGSKTACAVGDDLSTLAVATAGGSNPVRVGPEQARAALQAAIHVACERAGVSPREITRTCIGIAGASSPETGETVRQILGETVSGSVIVVGDMEIAMEAAFVGAPGVIVIAGTGSIAFGRNQAGETARAGGWGYAISDEGSGHWIGRRAVGAIMHAHELGIASELEGAVLGAWSVGSREELVKTANSMPPPDFARVFPAVVTAARAGDAAAIDVLDDAGQQLARIAALVLRRLWPNGAWARVALAGGVFKHSPQVRQAFYSTLRQQRPQVAVSFSIVEPVAGALMMARDGSRS